MNDSTIDQGRSSAAAPTAVMSDMAGRGRHIWTTRKTCRQRGPLRSSFPPHQQRIQGLHPAAATWTPSSTPAVTCPLPPAAPAWAATWASWRKGSAVSPPPTATLSAAWAMPIQRGLSRQPVRSRPPVRWPARSLPLNPRRR